MFKLEEKKSLASNWENLSPLNQEGRKHLVRLERTLNHPSIQFNGARLGELDTEMHPSSQMRNSKGQKNELCNQAICLIMSVKDEMCIKIPHNRYNERDSNKYNHTTSLNIQPAFVTILMKLYPITRSEIQLCMPP